MLRIILLLPIILIASCTSPETLPIPPLPVGEAAVPYRDLLTRIRSHAGTATDSFFRDEWDAVAGSARHIEQAAGYLPAASDVPPHLTKRIAEESQALIRAAKRLSDGATQKDAAVVGDGLSQIQFRIRALQSAR